MKLIKILLLSLAASATCAAEAPGKLATYQLYGQSQLGKLVAGPILEESARRGIVVYRVAPPEEATERAEAGPMVKARRLQVELHPWQLAVGALPAAKTSQ